MSAQPFRLLDLPAEVRLMVYEHISISDHHHAVVSNAAMGESSTVTLVQHSLPVSLLSTCRLIQCEATPIFAARFVEIKSKPMRFIVDELAAQLLDASDSPLLACFGVKPRSLLRPTPRPHLATNAPHYHNMFPVISISIPGTGAATTPPSAWHRDPATRYESADIFIARCTTILSWTRQAPLTRFDIGFYLSDALEQWRYAALHESVWDLLNMSLKAELAVVIVARRNHPSKWIPGSACRWASELCDHVSSAISGSTKKRRMS